ncbi:hypothetical protein ALC56_12776 [Trachymyrmex septentrionalis]|uniref:Uncharacterized protein n=1 Tax=Trachymyrmex septentrionalis TaxID=34720 RepID=A0A195EXF3_9HYME|nr:hypothetical protein ALC56_12776 [Trachymyrmex septentrionalis]
MPLVHLRRRYKTPVRPAFKFEECRKDEELCKKRDETGRIPRDKRRRGRRRRRNYAPVMVDTFAVVLATSSYIPAQEFQPREQQWREQEKRRRQDVSQGFKETVGGEKNTGGERETKGLKPSQRQIARVIPIRPHESIPIESAYVRYSNNRTMGPAPLSILRPQQKEQI